MIKAVRRDSGMEVRGRIRKNDLLVIEKVEGVA
jgi:hypothetical protein